MMYGFEISTDSGDDKQSFWSPISIKGTNTHRVYFHVYPKRGFSGSNPSGSFGFCFPVVLQHPTINTLYAILASKFSYDPSDFISETVSNVSYTNSLNDFHIHNNIRLVDSFICREYKNCCHCIGITQVPEEERFSTEYNVYHETFSSDGKISKIPPVSWWYFWYSVIICSIGKNFLENSMLCETYLKNGLVSGYSSSIEDNYKIFTSHFMGTLNSDGDFVSKKNINPDAIVIFKINYKTYQEIGFKALDTKMKLPKHVHSEKLVEMLWTLFGYYFDSQSGIGELNRSLEFFIPTACFPYSLIFMELSDSLLTKIYGNGGFSRFANEVMNRDVDSHLKNSKQRLRDEYLSLSSNQNLSSQSSFYSETNIQVTSLQTRSEILLNDNISKVYNRQKITKYGYSSKGPKNKNNYIELEPIKTNKCGKITYYVSLSKEKFDRSIKKFSEKKIETLLVWVWDLFKICAMEDYSKNLSCVRDAYIKPQHRSKGSQNSNMRGSGPKDQDLRTKIPQNSQKSDSVFQLLSKSSTTELDQILKRYGIFEGCVKAFHNFDSDSFLIKKYSESKTERENQYHFLVRFTIDDLISRYSCFKSVIETVDISKLFSQQDVVIQHDLRKSNSSQEDKRQQYQPRETNRQHTQNGQKTAHKSNVEDVIKKLKILPNEDQKTGFLQSSSFSRSSLSSSAKVSTFNVNEAGKDLLVSYIFQLVNALRSYHSQKLIHRDLHSGNILPIMCPTIFRVNFTFYESDSKLFESSYQKYNSNNSATLREFNYFMVPYGNPNLLDEWMNSNSKRQSFSEIVALSKKYFPEIGIIDVTGAQMGSFNESNNFIGDFVNKNFVFTDKEIASKQIFIKTAMNHHHDILLHSLLMGTKIKNDPILPRCVLYNSYRHFLADKVFQNFNHNKVPIFSLNESNAEQTLFLEDTENGNESKKMVPFSAISPSAKSIPFINNAFKDDGESNDHQIIVSISDYTEVFGFVNHRPSNYFIYRAPEQFETVANMVLPKVKKDTENQQSTGTNTETPTNQTKIEYDVHRFQPITNMVDMYSLGIRLMTTICDFEIIYCYGKFPFTRRQKGLNPNFDVECNQNFGSKFNCNFSVGCDGTVFGNPFKCYEDFNKSDYGLSISRIFYKGPIDWNGLDNNTHKKNYPAVCKIIADNFGYSNDQKTMYFDYSDGFLPENVRLMTYDFEYSSSSPNPLCNDFCANSKHITDNLLMSKSDVQFSKKIVMALSGVITTSSCFKNDFWLFSSSVRQRFRNIQKNNIDSEILMVVNIVLMYVDACGIPDRYQKFLDIAVQKFLDVVTDAQYSSFCEAFTKKLARYRSGNSKPTEISVPFINKSNYGALSKYVIDRFLVDSLPFSLGGNESTYENKDQHGVLDIFFKMLTNIIFEHFAIYVICENVITEIIQTSKEKLKELSSNFDVCLSSQLKSYISNTCLLSYGVDPLDELSKLIRYLDRTVHKPNDSTVLEYIDIRNKIHNTNQKSGTMDDKNPKRWLLRKDHQPSYILFSKICGNGYLKPTLNNFLVNKFKFGINDSNNLSNLIFASLSWDPVDRPSTLEFMHLNIFNRFKLVPDTYDLVKNESKNFSIRDLVIKKGDPLDILTIHFHSSKNYQLCNQSFADDAHLFGKVLSSDFSSSRFIEKRLSEGFDYMAISVFNSYSYSCNTKLNLQENIFYLGSVAKDYSISKAMLDTCNSYINTFLYDQSTKKEFCREFASGWIKKVFPSIMKLNFELSMIQPMVGFHVPMVSQNQQKQIMNNIIISGFLSLPDKKSLLNPLRSSFDTVFVKCDINLGQQNQIDDIGFFAKFDVDAFQDDTEIVKVLVYTVDCFKEYTKLFFDVISSRISSDTHGNLTEKIRQNFNSMCIANNNFMESFNH